MGLSLLLIRIICIQCTYTQLKAEVCVGLFLIPLLPSPEGIMTNPACSLTNYFCFFLNAILTSLVTFISLNIKNYSFKLMLF